jgi:regulator of protease activity HflC (stomatin/prohibitin superfamily)
MESKSNRESLEIARSTAPAALMLVLEFVVLGVAIWSFVTGVRAESPVRIVGGTLIFLLFVVGIAGFFVVQPNEARVLVLFGNYKGSVKKHGFWWTNPFTSRYKISLRVRNFTSDKLKVNDLAGNPIEIAAVIVWRVVDTYEAKFVVDDYENFVQVQSESAVRHLASSYPYDEPQPGEKSLRGSLDEVTETLRHELQARLSRAGVVVDEARLAHLAYAPEIAHAMLRRQQAAAVIAARTRIVEGAVGMVEMALEMLSKQHIIDLDEERKAAMVSNLLVVLCGDRDVSPVVNTGTLHS